MFALAARLSTVCAYFPHLCLSTSRHAWLGLCLCADRCSCTLVWLHDPSCGENLRTLQPDHLLLSINISGHEGLCNQTSIPCNLVVVFLAPRVGGATYPALTAPFGARAVPVRGCHPTQPAAYCQLRQYPIQKVFALQARSAQTRSGRTGRGLDDMYSA